MFTWVSSYPKNGNCLVRELIHFLENGNDMFKSSISDYQRLGTVGITPYRKIHSSHNNLADIDYLNNLHFQKLI